MAKEKKTLGIFFLTMINLATILSVRNWPMTAEYGYGSIGYLCLAMLFFFIPASLVSAELATGWPQKGGIFVWVKEALGHKLGFLAVWLLWVENVVWYPTILSFIAASLAFAFAPSLADNAWYTFFVILLIFWTLTYANLRGMKFSGWLSTIGVLLGTILPGVAIILLGFIWISTGHPSEITFAWGDLVPKFSNVNQMALFTGILLSFCGIEMSAVHAKDVENPQKSYPKAIFFSASTIIILTILGTLSIAFIIPKSEISLVSGSIAAIASFLNSYQLGYLIPLIAILISVGALGGVSTWTAGPCKGLLAAAEKGDFPPLMHKVNKHKMPVSLMVMQASIVSVLAMVFIFMPNISASFWILSVLASQLYLIMYTLMFISAIVLRYKRKDVERTYKVPFGNVGMWVVCGMGLVASVSAICVGFFPLEQIDTGSKVFFFSFLASGIVIFCSIPFIILACQKESWFESSR